MMDYDESEVPATLSYAGGDLGKSLHDPRMPIRKKLMLRIGQREEELKELREALEALDKNPDFEKLHDTLTRVSRFL
jgi:hypothetical protein